MQFCGLKLWQKKMESLPKAMTFVGIFSCLTSTPLISTLLILEIQLWVRLHVNIFMKKELCEIFPNISKTLEIWQTLQMANIQSHTSDIYGSTANDVYPHKFYST